MGFRRPPDEQGHAVPPPRGVVRAEEELFYIPDQSTVAVCRALIAADIDGFDRSVVEIVDGGMRVPHCVYTVYNDLLGYPPPCCACAGTMLLSFVHPQPLYFDDYEDLYCYGAGFPEGSQVCVNGIPVSSYEAWYVNANLVVGFFDIFDQFVAGQRLDITVAYGDQVSNPYTVIMQPRPPQPTLNAVSPTTAVLGQPFDIHVYGTNFKPDDKVNWHPPSGTSYSYWELETTFVTDVELIGKVLAPNYQFGPGAYYVQVGARPERSEYAERQFVTVA